MGVPDRSMLAPSSLARTAPLVASCLLHLGLAALAVALGPLWTPPEPPAIIEAKLVPAEAPPPLAEAPRPAPPPKPIVLPRPLDPPKREIAAPAPDPTPAPPPPPTPPEPVAVRVEPSPPPSRTAPADPAPRAPAPASRRPAAGAPATVEAVPAPLPARPGSGPVAPPASASAATDAPSQLARPRGGYQVKPVYPSSARRLGVEGTALLSVYVAADGQVTEVQVHESAGHPDLDRAAVDAVRRWRFEPGRRGAEPIGMWVRLPVHFVLR
jgi:protein TonB